MHLVIARFESFDREIVDSDQFRALVAKPCRGFQVQVSEIGMKLVWYLAAKHGITRLKENALGSRRHVSGDELVIDHEVSVRHRFNKYLDDERFDRQKLH